MLSRLDPSLAKAIEILRPDDAAKLVAMEHGRFVHYTSVEAAVSILQCSQAWLRSSTTQNDFREIEHGRACLEPILNSEQGARLRACIDGIFPRLWAELMHRYRSVSEHLSASSFLACMSEHDPTEDEFGRLSMWRAYGDVALVLNPTAFMTVSDALGVYSSPVHYRSLKDFETSFSQLCERFEAHKDFFHSLGDRMLLWHLLHYFIVTVLCTKHPGFHEEREWRVFHLPFLQPSDKVLEEIRVIRGIAQRIYKVPLRDYPDEGYFGAALPSLINRIIIGPTQFPWVMYEAFVSLLKTAGVSEPETKVVVSDIPLRRG